MQKAITFKGQHRDTPPHQAQSLAGVVKSCGIPLGLPGLEPWEKKEFLIAKAEAEKKLATLKLYMIEHQEVMDSFILSKYETNVIDFFINEKI